MRISSYLATSRHGLYYFRFPIPQRFHPQNKQSDVKLSLVTRSPQEALHLARALSYVGQQLLRRAEMHSMEYQQIRDILSDRFKRAVDQRTQRIAQLGPLSEIERQSLENTHGFAVQALEDKDYGFIGDDAEINKIIHSYSMPIRPNTTEYELLRTEYLKAFRDYCTSVLQQDAALSSYSFTSNSAVPTSTLKARKLADSVDEYCKEKLRLQQWREHIGKDYRSQFNLLLEYLGKDASLHLSPEVAADVKAMLIRLPKNRNKGTLKNLALSDQLKASNAQRISPTTVNKHLATYSAFYDWVMNRKHTNENPFRPLIDDVKKTQTERDDFSNEQARKILEAAMAARETHHKWGALIGFYTGARVNEIAQLHGKDIMQEDGVWCFHFTDDGEQQRLKNDASKRTVPIHSRLLELGFLDLVHKAGNGRIFPKLSYDPKHGYGRSISRWFNETLLPKLGIKSSTLMYHCIRHTVAQRLRNNKVPEATIKDILGHAQGDVTMGVYANNLDKRVMREAIETLGY